MNNLKLQNLFEKFKNHGFYVLLFMLCAALAVRSTNYDFDLWARLIAGKAILQTGHILKYDFLSYTPTHAWYDHEWGSSVVFYFFQSNFGHLGLLSLQVLLVFLTMFFLVKTVKLRYGENYNYKNLLIYFIILNSFLVTYSSLIRCHSFTFMLFMIEIYILELVRKNQNYKLLYIFPPMFLIWGNMHGGVVSGLGILFLYAIGEALNRKQFKYYLITSIICPLMLFINPYGVEFVKFLIKAVTMPRPDVVEWWCIFHKYNYKFFMPFKLSALFYLILELVKVIKTKPSYARLDKTKFIVMLVTLFMAIKHVKMMPFFALTATAFCYGDIYDGFKNFRFPKWGMPSLTTFLVIFSLLMLGFKDYRPMVNFKAYPIMEVEFIKSNKLTGKILNNFGFGSYVSYKLYPQNKIYMDGRYEEVYDQEVLDDLNKFYTLKPGGLDLLDRYKPDVLLLEQEYPIYKYLNSPNSGWTMIFKGFNFAVFVPSDKAKDDYNPPNGDLKYYKKTVFNTMITFKGPDKIDVNAINKRNK